MRKFIAVMIAAMVVGTLTTGVLGQAKTAQGESATAKATTISKVAGTVVRQDGKPAVGIKVYIQTGSRGETARIAQTDAKGNFAFDRPKDGGAWIYAIAPGCVSTRVQWWPDRKDSLRITLRPGSKLRGVVVDEKGKPLEGAKVTLDHCYAYGSGTSVPEVQLPPELATVTTGKNGAFVFDHIPSLDMEYIDASLEVETPGRAQMSVNAHKQDIEKGLKITDPLECKIDGTLYLPGKTGSAPEGTRIYGTVTSARSSQNRGSQVQKDGKFHFAKLPPGDLVLNLGGPSASWTDKGMKYDPPHPWALPAKRVKLSPKQTASLELELVRGSLISGKVVDKKTEKPIQGARLSIKHAGRPESWRDDYQTDAAGEFKLRVPPGTVMLSVEAIESGSSSVYFNSDERPETSVNATDGEDKTDVIVAVDPGSRVDYAAISKAVPADFELKPGTYDLAWDPEITTSNRSYGRGKYSGKGAASRVKVMPKTDLTHPECMAFSFDSSENDGLLLLVFDRSKNTKTGYDRVFADRNRNGDLTDDGGPLPLTGSRSSYKRTDWFEVQACQGAPGDEQTHNPYQVRLQVYDQGDLYVGVQRKGGWIGKIDSSKGRVDCAVLDRNTNGTFSDTDRNGRGDAVFIDANGYGGIAPVEYGPQAIAFCKLCKVGTKFYAITPTKAGNKLTIEPYAGPMGQLLATGKSIQGISGAVSSLSVASDDGRYSFENCGGKPIDLPVGSYSVTSCGLSIGDKLPVTCGLTSKIAVTEAQPATVEISGPLKMTISKAEKKLVYRAGNTETVSWDITIGDKISVSSFGDQNAGAPKVKFFNSRGRLVGATSANYT